MCNCNFHLDNHLQFVKLQPECNWLIMIGWFIYGPQKRTCGIAAAVSSWLYCCTQDVALRVGVEGSKLYRRVPIFLAGHFLFTSSDTFAVQCII